MSEDLTTEDEAVLIEEEQEFVIEETTRAEYIACSYNAIQAVCDLTTMTKEDDRRKKRIIRKSIKIIENYINEMYDEIFEEEEEED